MKIKTLLLVAGICSAFAGCYRKCDVCSAYNRTTHAAEPTAQTVEVCRKAEIEAYETGTNFIAPNGDSVMFQCVPK